MKRQSLVRLLGVALLLAVMVGPGSVQAAKWKFGDDRYYSAERVCRDGLVVVAGWQKTDPAPGDTRTIPVGARLYANPALSLEPLSLARVEEFGPLLVPERELTMTYHEEPLIADVNEDGLFVIVFNVYIRETWRWSQLLDVGATVILHENNLILPIPVEDCLIEPLPVVGGGLTAAIAPASLSLNPEIAPAANTAYRIETLPANGRVLLNGQPLAVGGTFTQADIDAGRVTYSHNRSATSSDSFGFSVAATTRVSVAANDAQATGGGSHNPAINADGLRIVFDSEATNLVPGDTNNQSDIFLRDTQVFSTTRVSLSSEAAQASDGGSFNPTISADGQAFAFESEATNLAGGGTTSGCDALLDTNDDRDVFLRSFELTRRVSVRQTAYASCQQTSLDSYAPSLGGDEFTVAFGSDANNLDAALTDTNGNPDSFTYDNGTTGIVSRGSGPLATGGASIDPSLSGDGTYVAFSSTATAGLITAGTDTNNLSDIFVRNTSSGTTVRVSVSTAGVQAQSAGLGSFRPSISPNGWFVAFDSFANNLVSGDNDTISDVFVRDRNTDGDTFLDEGGAVKTVLVSVASEGTQGNGNSSHAAISADGRYVAFQSDATNLVEGDTNGQTDIFLHDRDTDGDGIFDEPGAISTIRISVAANGAQATGGASINPAISYDGMFVTFESQATNLVADDTNGQSDVFVRYTGYSSTLSFVIEPREEVFLPLVVR